MKFNLLASLARIQVISWKKRSFIWQTDDKLIGLDQDQCCHTNIRNEVGAASLMMAKLANDDLLHANDGEMLVNDGEMSVWSYTHFTIID